MLAKKKKISWRICQRNGDWTIFGKQWVLLREEDIVPVF
jgi:hypothetical protein